MPGPLADPAAWLAVAAAIVAISGALFAIAKLSRWVWVTARKIGHLVDDLTGEPPRDGSDGRPSLMARVKNLEERTEELLPNHGTSIKDRIGIMDKRLSRVEQKLCPNPGPTAGD